MIAKAWDEYRKGLMGWDEYRKVRDEAARERGRTEPERALADAMGERCGLVVPYLGSYMARTADGRCFTCDPSEQPCPGTDYDWVLYLARPSDADETAAFIRWHGELH